MLEIGIFLLLSKGTLWIMDKCRMFLLVVTGTHDEECPVGRLRTMQIE
jgi:hypothetical protein